MFHPISVEAEQGKEYQEVLLAKLSYTSAAIKTLTYERGCLYPINCQEWLAFVNQLGHRQHEEETVLMDYINSHCRSYKEDYRNHLISQTEYDSLEWLVSPMVITLPVNHITATEATSGIDILGKGYYGGMELGVC